MTIIEIRTSIKPDHYFFRCQLFNILFRQIKVGRKTHAAGFQKTSNDIIAGNGRERLTMAI